LITDSSRVDLFSEFQLSWSEGEVWWCVTWSMVRSSVHVLWR